MIISKQEYCWAQMIGQTNNDQKNRFIILQFLTGPLKPAKIQIYSLSQVTFPCIAIDQFL